MVSNKTLLRVASTLLLVSISPTYSAHAFVKDATAHEEADCSADSTATAIQVLVQGIKSVEGNLRAQIYGSDPKEFLEKGKKLIRVDVPVKTGVNLDDDEQYICVPVPDAGKYALVIMHDKNANGKADIFSEGFGFSNNPKLGLSAPDGEDVMIDVPTGILRISVGLKYIFGSSDENEKRRKLKRR